MVLGVTTSSDRSQEWKRLSRCHQPDLVPHVRYVTELPSSTDTRTELINIFEIFLPQLLRYPNPADPLNGEAAALLMRDPKAYAKKVESYVDKYASNEDADRAGENGDDDEPMSRSSRANGNGHTTAKEKAGSDDEDEDEDDDPMSDMGELSDGDEFMGEMDD